VTFKNGNACSIEGMMTKTITCSLTGMCYESDDDEKTR
jgi:hypothetical protein